MSTSRRCFVKKIVAGTVGIAIAGIARGHSSILISTIEKKCLNLHKAKAFPFFKYLRDYNLGDYIPKDQGGKFVQQEILETEDDRAIVEKVMNGALEAVYGNPIGWGKLEKTELEKSVWLNRFYYLPSFARLYCLTGENVYLTFMVRFISKWADENPRSGENTVSKYNWYDMQVAWRVIHLSWCYYLTEKGLTEEEKKLIIGLQIEHAGILLDHFGKQPLNEFNHQSHGALAMLYLGVLFPGLPQAGELIAAAVKILEHHINHAFYPDGGNVEQMFGYYPFEAHIFRDALLLCRVGQIPLPGKLIPLLHKMAGFISSVAQPDGTMPPVNDSYPMPVTSILKTLGDVLNVGFPVHTAQSAYFPDTQIGILRAKNATNNWYLLANPAMTIGAHAHAGKLAFNLWYNNQPFIIESGCCNYDKPMLVSWYRTSRAHNTVLIDGKSDEATSKPDQWAPKRQTANRITDWIEKPSFCFCRMVSPATEPDNLSVNWSRSLAIVKNSFVVVYDCFEASEEHNYEILFHLPDIQVEEKKEAKGFLLKASQMLALLPGDGKAISKTEVNKGFINIGGADKQAPVLSFHLKSKEVHSVLVFSPVTHSTDEIKISQIISEEGLALTLENANGEKHTVIFRSTGADSAHFGEHTNTNCFEVF